MDEEEDKKDDEIAIPDAVLEEALGEDVEDEELVDDPLAAIDEFGGGTESNEKQWE